MKKGIMIVLIIACLAVMGYSGYKIISQQLEYKKGDDAYEELQQYKEEEGGTRQRTLTPTIGSYGQALAGDPSNPYLEVELPEGDFAALSAINKDTIGWVYCADTHIDYPVVQGADNDYYLHRLFEGGYAAAGSIFLDAENHPDFSDFHMILYGHHMKNGSMFRDLEKYKDEEFFKAHPIFILMTPEKNYAVEIFSGYVSSVNEDSWKLYFTDHEDMAAWIDEICQKSDVDTGIVPQISDRILTLSTCSYEFSDARYVLHGVLHELG